MAEVAQELDLPLSTVYRFVRQLRQFGLVEEAEAGVYVVGPTLLSLAVGHPLQEQLRIHAEASLRQLAAATGETAILTMRVDTSAVVVAQVESPKAIRLSFAPGSRHPLHAGASATVLLAFESDAVVDQVLKGPLPRFTERTLLAADALRRRIAEIRLAGYAVSTGEVDAEATAVAAPVFNNQRLLCALSVAGPSVRMGEFEIPKIARLVVTAANQLEHDLSGSRPGK